MSTNDTSTSSSELQSAALDSFISEGPSKGFQPLKIYEPGEVPTSTQKSEPTNKVAKANPTPKKQAVPEPVVDEAPDDLGDDDWFKDNSDLDAPDSYEEEEDGVEDTVEQSTHDEDTDENEQYEDQETEDGDDETSDSEEGEGRESEELLEGEDEVAPEDTSEKKSRVPKRINSLINKLKAKDNAIAEKEFQYIDALRKLAEENAQLKELSATSLIRSAESRVEQAKKAFKLAAEEADIEAQMAATEELSDAKAELNQAKQFQKEALSQLEQFKPTQVTKELVYATNKANSWAESNAKLLTNPYVKTEVIKINKTLLAEGSLEHTDEHWDALNARLNKVLKAKNIKGRAMSIYDDEGELVGGEIAKVPTKPAKPSKGGVVAPQKKQATKPILKAPPVSVGNNSRAQYRLTNEDKAFLRANPSLSPEVYLRNKAIRKRTEQEKAKGMSTSSYTPIYIPTK